MNKGGDLSATHQYHYGVEVTCSPTCLRLYLRPSSQNNSWGEPTHEPQGIIVGSRFTPLQAFSLDVIMLSLDTEN